MTIFKKTLIAGALLAPAMQAYSHVYWDASGNLPPRNSSGVSCGEKGNTPAVFKSGAKIMVTYNVAVKHGDTVRIEFSPADSLGFEDNLLLETAAVAGFNDATITLPDIECDGCTLRVWESGYQSCADIHLTATGLTDGNTMDVEPPAEVSHFLAQAADKSIALSWINPSDDFYRVVIVQSDEEVMAAPSNAESYTEGDHWANATVVYSGAASEAVVSGLNSNTLYHYKIFTADARLNYSVGTELMATTTQLGNSQPEATLTVMQDNVITSQILTDAGHVYIQAAIIDFDTEDRHSLDWSATDYRLSDVNTDEAMFEFDPSNLMPGDYSIVLTVSDDGTPSLSDTQTMMINVQSSEADVSNDMAAAGDNSTGGGMGILSLILLALFSFGRSTCAYIERAFGNSKAPRL